MAQKVLLCVDDEAVGLSIRKLLLERSGYRVLTAETGAAGLGLLQSHEVSAVVLDYYLGDIQGDEVAARMKQMKPQVPILMLSAYLSLPEGALKHVDAFVTKGQPPQLLLETLSKLIRHGENG